MSHEVTIGPDTFVSNLPEADLLRLVKVCIPNGRARGSHFLARKLGEAWETPINERSIAGRLSYFEDVGWVRKRKGVGGEAQWSLLPAGIRRMLED